MNPRMVAQCWLHEYLIGALDASCSHAFRIRQRHGLCMESWLFVGMQDLSTVGFVVARQSAALSLYLVTLFTWA